MPPNASRFRLREPVSYLRTRARALIAGTGFEPSELALVKELGFHGISASIQDYEWKEDALLKGFEQFARDILQTITMKPLSLEVFSDEFPEMKRQALKINGWGKNVYVKIPITNTRKESSLPLIKELATEGVKLNVTAILTLEQVRGVAAALNAKTPAVVSVFAGRIADTGVDPSSIMAESKKILKGLPQAELLWASVREVLILFRRMIAAAKS